MGGAQTISFPYTHYHFPQKIELQLKSNEYSLIFNNNYKNSLINEHFCRLLKEIHSFHEITEIDLQYRGFKYIY